MLLDYSTRLYYASFQELKSPNQSFAVIITHIFPSAGLCSVMRSRLHCLELWLLNKSEFRISFIARYVYTYKEFVSMTEAIAVQQKWQWQNKKPQIIKRRIKKNK